MKKVALICIIFVLSLMVGFDINDIIVQNKNLSNSIWELTDIIFDLIMISVLVYEWMKILRKNRSSNH